MLFYQYTFKNLRYINLFSILVAFSQAPWSLPNLDLTSPHLIWLVFIFIFYSSNELGLYFFLINLFSFLVTFSQAPWSLPNLSPQSHLTPSYLVGFYFYLFYYIYIYIYSSDELGLYSFFSFIKFDKWVNMISLFNKKINVRVEES